MKIAILYRNPLALDCDAFLRLQGLKSLLSEHTLSFHCLTESKIDLLKAQVRSSDLVLWNEQGDSEVTLECADFSKVKELGVPVISYGAVSCLFSYYEKLKFNLARALYAPGELDGVTLAEQGKLAKSIGNENGVTYLVQSIADFERGASVCISTFFSPTRPSYHGRAIVSSSHVVTARPEVALTAVAHQIPAVLLVSNEVQERTAAIFGIPSVSVTERDSIGEKVSSILQNYPWTDVTARVIHLMQQFAGEFKSKHIPLSDIKLKRSVHLRLVEKPIQGEAVNVCSISNLNYLPFLEGWMTNILEMRKGPTHFHILALDVETKVKIEARFQNVKKSIYMLSDLWEAEELKEIQSRSIGVQAFSSKPRLILEAIKRTHSPAVYADSDVFFFQDPGNLVKELNTDKMLLFPHWNDQFPEARKDGLYNAGMLVAGTDSEWILNWWADSCLESADIDETTGVVGDQGYLDFVPVIFEGVSIYRKGDHNVARWNLNTLCVDWNHNIEATPMVDEKIPVASYHAAFIDSKGVFEIKYCWDQLIALYGGRETAALRQNTFHQLRLHWLRLGRAYKLLTQLRLNTRHLQFFSTGWFGNLIHSCITLLREEPVFASYLRRPSSIHTSSWIQRQRRVFSHSIEKKAA